MIILLSCNSDTTPKPNGYPRIERESISAVSYNNGHISFYYPSDATVKEEQRKDEGGQKEIWFNIIYRQFHAKIFCTYIQTPKSKLPELIEDSRHLAYSHMAKSSGILQTDYENPSSGVYGKLYTIEGDVASPLQFYMTDNRSNFLRGALYFDQQINIDSVQPVISFIKDDIAQVMETARWNFVELQSRANP
ncbi:hypothetical protein D0T57_00795 [Dysgonomonas sp. 511]|nr:hypothetical protein [Dysgonomonas sp. 511]